MSSNTTAVKALKIVVQHEEGTEIERLRDENKKLNAALDAIKKEISEKSKYYMNLVWYARRTTEEQERHCPQFWDQVKESIGGDEKRYKKFLDDVDRLSGEDGDWNHGFYSGCLAMARLAIGLTVTEDIKFDEDTDSEDGHVLFAEDNRSCALEEFPMLDTYLGNDFFLDSR